MNERAGVVEIQLEEPETDASPGPRLARTLAEQAAITERKRARRRRLVGFVFLLVGLAVAGVAAWSYLTQDDNQERKVGKLTASNLDEESDAATTAAPPSDEGEGEGEAPATTAASAEAPPAQGEPTGGGEPRWPSAIEGRPAALGKQGEPPPASTDLEDAFYLWQDFNGWHLWVVGGGSETVTVTADDQIAKAEPVGGDVAIEQTGNVFTFSRGAASEQVVGVDFNPGYYAKTIVVSVDGELRLRVGGRRWVVPDYYGLQFSTAST